MIPPFEAFDFSTVGDTFSTIASAGHREHELSEFPALPVLFDPPPPHPTTPVNGFAITDNDVYNTFPLSESNAVDYFTWAGHLLEEYPSDGFLSSSMDVGGFKPSSSSLLMETLEGTSWKCHSIPTTSYPPDYCVLLILLLTFAPPSEPPNLSSSLFSAPEATVSRRYYPSLRITNRRKRRVVQPAQGNNRFGRRGVLKCLVCKKHHRKVITSSSISAD